MQQKCASQCLSARNLPLLVAGCVFAAIVMAGCANVSSLQTARAVEPGEFRLAAGAGLAQVPEFRSMADTQQVSTRNWPYLEAAGRVGIIPRLDVGVKATFVGTFGIDAKYQFVDAGPLAVATGLGFGLIWNDDSSWVEANTEVTDVMLPLYLSYDFADAFAAYVSPKYIFRNLDGAVKGNEHLFGGTAGFKLGNRNGLFVEGTWLRTYGADIQSVQVNAAVFTTIQASTSSTEAEEEVE